MGDDDQPAGGPPPGTQWERTRFAWRRTVLAGTAVALLALRQALLAGPGWVRGLGSALVMLVWLAGLVAAHRRVVTLNHGRLGAGRAPLVAAGVAVGFAVLGLILLPGSG